MQLTEQQLARVLYETTRRVDEDLTSEWRHLPIAVKQWWYEVAYYIAKHYSVTANVPAQFESIKRAWKAEDDRAD